MKKIVALLLALLLSFSALSFAGESWTCPNCGTENTTPFCGQCGTQQPGQDWVCPNCGKTADTPFCPYCGTPGPGEAPAEPTEPTEPTEAPAEPTEDQTPAQTVAVGDTLVFGTYPQTADGTDKTPVEWQVLEVRDGKALLLSRYGLDAKPYHTSDADVTWETCALRAWLNGEFLRTAFTEEEQARIELTNVDNGRSQCYGKWSASGGNDTQDRVFLLSCAEANRYLGVTRESENNLTARSAPTAYAKKRGAYSYNDKTREGAAAGCWWLRSPGYLQYFAACVFTAGSLYYGNVGHENGCVRPALWISIS